MAGIRSRHPDYDDLQVLLAYARLTLGDELVLEAWAGRELVEPFHLDRDYIEHWRRSSGSSTSGESDTRRLKLKAVRTPTRRRRGRNSRP
jgi:hypothetical protein